MNAVPVVRNGNDWVNPPGAAHRYRVARFKIPGLGLRWYGTLDGEAVGIMVYNKLHTEFHTKEALLEQIAVLLEPPVAPESAPTV